MTSVDPTYPLRPIACILAAAMLLLVLTTSFIRQNWNLGVTFLCSCLFLQNLADGVDAIAWSDNADIKLYVYCDIESRLGLFTYVLHPMSTLIITRRLYLITNFQSVHLHNKAERRWNLILEWTLGLLIPLIVAGPIYYVHQGYKFQIYEGFGCADATQLSILSLLTIEIWSVVPPLVSVAFYYPRVLRTFYRQSRDASSFLNTNNLMSSASYRRILILASIDFLLTLPLAIVGNVLSISAWSSNFPLPFYWGWASLHSGWDPASYSYAELEEDPNVKTLAYIYFYSWSTPVLSFMIFGLFGLTSEARASYWRTFCTVCAWFGWASKPRMRNSRQSLGNIEFSPHPQDVSLYGIEMEDGYGSQRPSFATKDSMETSE